MGNKELFKTVLFGGFQKEEVWNYMQEVEAEIEGGRQVAERAQQEYAQQLEEENLMRQKLSQQLSDEQERTEKLEEEKNAMESELGTLQAEAESLRWSSATTTIWLWERSMPWTVPEERKSALWGLTELRRDRMPCRAERCWELCRRIKPAMRMLSLRLPLQPEWVNQFRAKLRWTKENITGAGRIMS